MIMNERFSEIVERIARADAQYAADAISFEIKCAAAACESPIEEIMCAALMGAAAPSGSGPSNWGFHHRLCVSTRPFDRDRAETSNHAFAFLYVQAPVLEYRVDFLISFRFDQDCSLHLIVVECDGHAFHERTKEQAARDKKRDRDMTSAGFKVLRFTGSEIYRDPETCAREVSKFLDALAAQEDHP